MPTRIHRPRKARAPRGAAPKESSEPGALGLRLESPAFSSGDRIPARFTADGRNHSPALSWSALPNATRTLAVVCEDPDAPGSRPFVHWLLADLDPARAGTMLEEGTSAIPGAVLGKNSFGRIGYAGPEPPRGHGLHRYTFMLYALDLQLGLGEGFSREEFLQAIRGHVLATGELVGTYSR